MYINAQLQLSYKYPLDKQPDLRKDSAAHFGLCIPGLVETLTVASAQFCGEISARRVVAQAVRCLTHIQLLFHGDNPVYMYGLLSHV